MTSIRVMVTGRDKELLKQEPPLADSNILNLYSWSKHYHPQYSVSFGKNMTSQMEYCWNIQNTHIRKTNSSLFCCCRRQSQAPGCCWSLHRDISSPTHPPHVPPSVCLHWELCSTSERHIKNYFLKRLLVFRQIYIRYAPKNRQNPPLNWCCMKHWLCCWLTDTVASKAIWLSTSSEM